MGEMMQVFLPYPDVYKSFRCLDYKRLGKQRIECFQLLKALDGTTRNWTNHPAAQMFKNHIPFLQYCHDVAILVWQELGYKNNMVIYKIRYDHLPFTGRTPWWFGSAHFHLSHRDNLYRKDPEHYGEEFPGAPYSRYGYYLWPLEKPNLFTIGKDKTVFHIPFRRMLP